MQTSIVIGAFQFIGFHLAKYLLEQGEEVLGVDWEDGTDDTTMEKEMEIGRNSNFLFIPLDRLQYMSIIQPKMIYISCYDLSFSCIDNKQTIMQQIIAFLKAVEAHHDTQVILVLPTANDQSVFDALLQLVADNESAKMVYAPTIYGPWQPESMSFEATIREKAITEIESTFVNEDQSDALFISDIMEPLSQMASQHEKEILLQSQAPNQWEQCAKLLGIDEWMSTKATFHSRTTKGFVYKVENKTSPKKGISLQKKHVQLWKEWQETD